MPMDVVLGCKREVNDAQVVEAIAIARRVDIVLVATSVLMSLTTLAIVVNRSWSQRFRRGAEIATALDGVAYSTSLLLGVRITALTARLRRNNPPV